jgi:hypothetical protein
MVNPKPLCFLIILLVLFAGVYEKQTGNVMSVTHFGRRTESSNFKMIPGEVLIYFSVFLAAVATFVFRKDTP